MATTRTAVKDAAKLLAQDQTGLPLLDQDAAYDKVLDQAIERLSRDRPRTWVLDLVVATAGFRFVLAGSGSVMPSSGLDVWVDGKSFLVDVYAPFDDTVQGVLPNDPETWRVVEGPSATTVLELLDRSMAVDDVLRLVYAGPYQVGASAAATSVRAGLVEALTTVTAAILCEEAAIRYAQNTGNVNLGNDVADRRTQSDVMKSRSKDLWARYFSMMGIDPKADGSIGLAGASGFKDLDVPTGHGLPSLWHGGVNR